MKLKKSISILLALCMVLSLMSTVAFAADGVSYVVRSVSDGVVTSETRECTNYTVLNDDTFDLTSGWYVLNSDVLSDGTLTVTGDVHVILVDGREWVCLDSINLKQGNSLTIYGQEKGTGAMGIVSTTRKAGIGGDDNESGGNLVIHGGDISVFSNESAAIGGGYHANGGTFTIYGGSVTAISAKYGAAIGGGNGGAGGTINIYGGTVIVETGNEVDVPGGAGLGAGYSGRGGAINISGGTVIAKGGSGGAGINGTTTLSYNDADGVPAQPSVTANSYEGTVAFAKAFKDDSGKVYAPAATYTPLSDLAGKTLVPTEYTEPVITDAPSFRVQSLVLSGMIGVNFYMNLPAIEGVDYNDSYMTFTITGNDVVTDRDNFDPEDKNASGAYYGFTCYVNSIQMADIITATFHYTQNGVEKTVSKNYSVNEYLSTFDNNASLYDTETLALIRAIADYGHYAQPFLSAVNGWQIGVDYAEMKKHYTESYDYNAVKEAVSSKAIVKTIAGSSVEKVTYNLYLDSGTTLDLHFAVPEGAEFSATAVFNGNTYTAVKQDDRYRLSIPGIPAHLLGQMITVNGNCGGEFSVQVSALSYVYAVLNSSAFNNDAKNAMCALYNYYDAVMKYRATR